MGALTCVATKVIEFRAPKGLGFGAVNQSNLVILPGMFSLTLTLPRSEPPDLRSASRPARLVGKVVRGDLYFHVSAAQEIFTAAHIAMLEACEIACFRPTDDFNVVKIGKGGTVVSLLSYCNFFEEAFPRLEKACTVNMNAKSFRERSYGAEGNSPILHRKELLLAPDNPSRPLFEWLTHSLEERGIRPNKAGLGFRRQWEEYLAFMGVEVRHHIIVELLNDHG